MAISFDMSNYRSDFMISDAALPQRVETQINKEQTTEFAKLLRDLSGTNTEPVTAQPERFERVERVESIGSIERPERAENAKSAGSVENVPEQMTVKDTASAEQAGPPPGMRDWLPDDPFELARLILKGKVELKDIPADKITIELLKALIIVAKTEKINEVEEDEDGDEEEDFFAQDTDDLTESLEEVTLLDQILAILYKFIDAYTETRYNDEEVVLSGIEELVAEFPEIVELYSRMEEGTDYDDDTLKAHIAKMLTERTSEHTEKEEQSANVDSFVKSTEIPAETRTVETAQSTFVEEITKAIGEENVRLLEEAAKNGEIGEVKAEVRTEVKVEAKTEVRSDVKLEVDNDVKAEVKPVVEVKPEESAEIGTDVKSDAKAPRNVRTEEVKEAMPEKQQAPVESVSKQSVRTDEAADRAKAIAEELEMLRNARLNKNTVRPVIEEKNTAEEKEPAPIQAATPLETDTPIVFTRKDGSEITVRPGDVVAQAAKLVETAIAENKEQTEYSLVLNPAELGKITVKLVKAADGAISVTIAAENPRTQRILDQNSQLMQSNLRDDGIRLESWQVVRESQQETLAQDYNGSSKNPYYREDTPQPEEDNEEKSFADIIAAM